MGDKGGKKDKAKSKKQKDKKQKDKSREQQEKQKPRTPWQTSARLMSFE